MDKAQPENDLTQSHELAGLRAIRAFNDSLTELLGKSKLMQTLCERIVDVLPKARVALFVTDLENGSLDYKAEFPRASSHRQNKFSINIYNPDAGSPTARLVAGQSCSFAEFEGDPNWNPTTQYFNDPDAFVLPLHHDELQGAVVVLGQGEQKLDEATIEIVRILAPSITRALNDILRHQQMRVRLNDVEQQAEIFRQIDEELSNIIEINYVFTMIMDWGLRFTNADAAGLALYDYETETLRITSHYGYREDAVPPGGIITANMSAIAYRVARSGFAEVVPDVMQDKDYMPVADGMRTQMTVPIMRDQRVIAVLALESKKLNGFTDEHLQFVIQLTNRAGIALDNARLFEETSREREKLAHILRSITNIVIVIGSDSRIMLINESALLAFRLPTEKRYEGQLLGDVIPHKELRTYYREAIESDEPISGELELPNKRIYHANITQRPGVGHIIVMQDITHFKETDRLKTELVATVSHDLKQPLSVMRGYLDLLQMVNEFDERSRNYVSNLEYAFTNMRKLIDDLLDIANIEAGLQLEIETIKLEETLQRAIRNNEPGAAKKSLALSLKLPQSLPTINADPSRLEQIFNNLVSNAVKYTPPSGHVHVRVEERPTMLRVLIEDNGMGIGAEDQAQVFERFYRVRRPETDTIEGTGLGLAIVKSLVEAHGGKIDLKSELGVGTTFRVMLPVSD